MYLMIADEADQDGAKQFLIFAGVFFPSENTLKIHNSMITIREEFGFGAGDSLKSSVSTKPESVSHSDHAKAKNAVLELAANHNCKICCYVVPHNIAKGQSHEDRLKFGTNTLLMKFDQFLREEGGAPGAAFFDRTQDYKQEKYFREVFEHGLEFKGKRKRLERVVTIDNTGIGHSHLASLTDIVVGAFRFVANEPDKDKVGTILLSLLEKIMWGVVEDGELNVRERGICIRPLDIKNPAYQADIEAFIKRLVKYSSGAK